MIKRINYTDRRDIDRRDVKILRSSVACGLDAVWDLAAYDFPPDALVTLELTGTASFGRVRLEFGRVAEKRIPNVEAIDGDVLDVAAIEFKVIAPDGTARILGTCARLAVRAASDGQSPLLPVKKNPHLGNEIWRLVYDSDRSVLEINSRVIHDVDEFARSDCMFNALVFPDVIRQVLCFAARGFEEHPEATDEDPKSRWLNWGRSMLPNGDPIPPVDAASDDDDVDRKQWIEDVVRAFCDRHRLGDRLKDLLEGDSR